MSVLTVNHANACLCLLAHGTILCVVTRGKWPPLLQLQLLELLSSGHLDDEGGSHLMNFHRVFLAT